MPTPKQTLTPNRMPTSNQMLTPIRPDPSQHQGPIPLRQLQALEVRDEANNRNFKVNGHQVKPYYKGLNLSSNMGEVAHYKPIAEKIMVHPNIGGSKELWNCFGSRIHNKCGRIL
ncbi:hypothetical protein CR513_01478, partial [Mucuna pruriens]